MQFICLVYVSPGDFSAENRREEEEQFDEVNRQYDEQLRRAGQYLIGGALAPPGTARTVRVRAGRPAVTDGPFVETKEHVGGFFALEAGSLEEAVDIAARSPLAGVSAIEVREMKDINEPDWNEWAARTYGRR